MNRSRGIQTLFNDLIDEPQLTVVKGENRLVNLRNECLVQRYLYMMKLTGWRLDLLRKMIASDFFLSERTVINILDENFDLLKKCRDEKPTQQQLEERWPQYDWGMPELEQYL